MLAPVLIAARRPDAARDLTLDAADPVIEAKIAGVAVKLRVDLSEHEFVLLNPATADRLPVEWTGQGEAQVGRIRLQGRTAIAMLAVGGRSGKAVIAAYSRDCCAGVDGAIGPDLLPYGFVRWRRGDAPPAEGEHTFPLAIDSRTGPYVDVGRDVKGIRLGFTFYRSATVATAAAGAILARAWDGHWSGPPGHAAASFGLVRPVRTLAFGEPGRLGGFAFDALPVRIADFGGREKLPEDEDDPSAIVVAHRMAPQDAWPAVILGSDRLKDCAEIVYRAEPRTLTLRCAFGPL